MVKTYRFEAKSEGQWTCAAAGHAPDAQMDDSEVESQLHILALCLECNRDEVRAVELAKPHA